MHDTTRTGPATRAGRREWVGLAVLALPTLLLSLDMSVLYLALPHLSADLGAGSTQQLWIVDIYGFMIAGFLVTMGTLGDRIGRRRLLMIGAAAFGVASVVAAYSTSAEMLIVTRALMGVAGATLMPSTLALIGNMFRDAHQRGLAVAVWMSCFMGGMIIGPLVGGVLLEAFWWGSVFLLGVPVMALLLLVAPALLPEYHDAGAGRLDLTSVGLSLAAILPMIYGLKEAAKDGPGPGAVGGVLVGLVVGAVFVRRQQTLRSPLLDVGLFRNRSFSVALGVNVIGGVFMGGTFLLVSLYVQMVHGLSPLSAGLALTPVNLAMIPAALAAPLLARRIPPAYVISTGLVVAACGLLLLTQVASTGGLGLLVVGFTIAAVGIALPTALGTDMVLGSAPPEKAGSASSMSETSGELGIALGVATLGSIGAAVYHSQLVVPADAPASAAAARESIGAATLVAEQLPGPVGAALLESAHAAFTSGLNIAAGVGAVAFAALAVLAARTLRHVRPTASAGDREELGHGRPDNRPNRGQTTGCSSPVSTS